MSKAPLLSVTPVLEINLGNVEKIDYSNPDTDGLPQQAVIRFVSGNTETITGQPAKDLKKFEMKYTPDVWKVDDQ